MSTTTNLEHIAQLAEQLSPEEQLRLVEHLAQHLRENAGVNTAQRTPRDLYGIWRGRVPDDFDVESALQEIRQEWTHELDEFGK